MNYLIQRCKLNETFDPTGSFDNNIRLDYMGSAEFEFGAVPRSLRRITSTLDTRHWIPTSVTHEDGTQLMALVDKNSPPAIILRMNAFLDGTVHNHPNNQLRGYKTKEPTYLPEVLTPSNRPKWQKYVPVVDLWWDIEVDILYTLTQHCDVVTTTLHNTKAKFDRAALND